MDEPPRPRRERGGWNAATLALSAARISGSEVAAVLGQKENTVKTRIFRGRRQLQARLAGYYNGAEEVHDGHPRQA